MEQIEISNLRLAEPRRLYFEAQFERCIILCKSIKDPSSTERSELGLLTARCLLRLSKYDAAEKELNATTSFHSTIDAELTSVMLLAMSKIRQGDTVTGLSLLKSANAGAENAHTAVRSEIYLCQALAHWVERDITASLKLLRRVRADSDIIYARALELESYCYLTKDRLRDAAHCFVTTLLVLDSCRQKDYAIAARAIQALAKLAYELNDVALIKLAESRYTSMDWTSGIAEQRSITEYYIAEFRAFSGNDEDALAYAFLALEHAPSNNYRATIYTALAMYSEHAGDTFVASGFAKRAVTLIASMKDDELGYEGRESILLVAGAAAKYDAVIARKMYSRYSMQSANAMSAVSGSLALRGQELYTEGTVCDAEGDFDAAVRCYRQAHELFANTEHVSRAAIVAYRLAQISEDVSMKWYVAGVLKGGNNWLARGLSANPNDQAKIQRAESVNASYLSLSVPQREVLDLVCEGKSNLDIARLRNVREQTVKNMLSNYIYRAFGVATRTELMTLLRSQRNQSPMPEQSHFSHRRTHNDSDEIEITS